MSVNTKLYITDRIPGVPVILLVAVHDRSVPLTRTTLFTSVPEGFQPLGVTYVDTLDHADYALFPHALKDKEDDVLREHIARAREEAAVAGKVLIVFVGGDLSHDIFVEGVVVFKGSQYRHLMRANEVLVPPYVEDLDANGAFMVRSKSMRPTVSFCGWAGFSHPLQYARYLLRLWASFPREVLAPATRVYRKGLYWRRKALRAFKGVVGVDTRFVVRDSFSGNVKTISVDEQVARSEYIESIQESDYVLTPKGDGNFSVRFYETLSLGRIPVLIDTDMPLPLEDEISYEDCVLRVAFSDIDRLPTMIAQHYAGLTQLSYADMQRKARRVFETYLRYDVFFCQVFSSSEFRHALRALS